MYVKFVKEILDQDDRLVLGKTYEVEELDAWGDYWTVVDGERVRLKEDEVERVGEVEVVSDVKEMIQFIWEQLDNAAETAEEDPLEDYQVCERLRLAQAYLVRLEGKLTLS